MTYTTAYTAPGAAATMQISGRDLAKTVVVWADDEMILAVLPAPSHVRLDKLSAEVGKPVRPATEQEFSSLFPDCEPGAIPPFGSLHNLPAYVDESLGAHKEIIFNAGTHRDAIRMQYDDFVRLAKPRFSRVSDFAACRALSAGRMAHSGTKEFLRCRFLSSLAYALQEYAAPLLQETEGEAKERQQAMPAPV